MLNYDVTYKYIGAIKDKNSNEALSIKKIMEACDNDFIPPMSYRNSPTAG